MKPRPIYSVAPTGSRLFRRLAVGGAAERRGGCGLPIRDPADCQSAPRERGVALVVSLLMLSVVTFIAIAFLAVSNRERASVTIAASRTEAKFVAEAMLARAQSEILAQMISATNRYDYGLKVSTNLITPFGFSRDRFDVPFPNNADPMNVAYVDQDDRPLDGNGAYPAQLQMLANLHYDARPPVFIRTNNADTLPAADANFDFRFYLDFNRNGMYDSNGYLPVVNRDGVPVKDPNDNRKDFLWNLVGDPEWIGFLEYPDRPHGPTNRFIGRGAFLVLPMGKSLDLNFMHNQAKIVGPPAGANSDNLFYRNQGVGSWEMNLASFLVDLNNSVWWPPNGNGINSGPNYYYNTNAGSGQNSRSIGVAFNDARNLLNYRYEGSFRNLFHAGNTFRANATPPPTDSSQPNHNGRTNAEVISSSFVDLYSDGPLMLGTRWSVPVSAPVPAPPPSPRDDPTMDGWPGSFDFSTRSLTPYYDIQELFTDALPTTEPAYASGGLSTRQYDNVRRSLISLGRTNYPPATTNSTFDRYTVYRMLDQLGVDSVNYNQVGLAGRLDQTGTTNSLDLPPSLAGAGRMDINFDNIANGLGGMRFWEPLRFFTNAAHRLLRQYYPTNNNPDSFDASDPVTGQFAGNSNGLYPTNGLSLTGTGPGNGWTNLQIFPRNFYTANVHRLLQLSANIYDATRSHGTNFVNGVGVNNYYPTVPSVFRPIFYRGVDAGGLPIVSIAGYTNVPPAENMDEVFFNKNPWYDLRELALLGLTHGGSQDTDGKIRDINVYGIPAVVGAKKYLPNFNEFAMQTWVTGARKVELVKTGAGQFATNVAMILALTNVLGMELFNSYAQDYPRGLEVRAWNITSWYVTNSTGMVVSMGPPGIATNLTNIITNYFSTNMSRSPKYSAQKFTQVIPAGAFIGGDFISKTQFVELLPASIYIPTGVPEFKPWPGDTNLQSALFQPLTTEALAMDLTLVVSNSFQYVLVDHDPVKNGDNLCRVVDCVNLANLTAVVNLAELFNPTNTPFTPGQPVAQITLQSLWSTNLMPNSSVLTRGVFNQLFVCRNDPSSYTKSGWNWNDYAKLAGSGSANTPTLNSGIIAEVNGWRDFLGVGPLPGTQGQFNNGTNKTRAQAPFTPAQMRALDYRWQANDPLVHYMADDLLPVKEIVPKQIPLKGPGAIPPTDDFNIGKINNRYEPWGRAQFSGFTNAYNYGLKDPGITRSDNWDFPANAELNPGPAGDFSTNYFANVGWLGRVHRGTPWQTVYLKSAYQKDQNNPDPGLVNSIRSTQLFYPNGQPVLDTNGVAVTNYNYLVRPRDWLRWAGNEESHPTNDWKLFNVFTATYGATAERGLLSVNQTNLAAWSAVLGGVMVLSNDLYAANNSTTYSFMDLPIDPSTPGNPQMTNIVRAINEYRHTNFIGGVFTNLGNLLGVPELTIYSPYLNGADPSWIPQDLSEVDDNDGSQIAYGLTDAAYERIPQQMLSLVQLEPFPRFIIYAYGQALRPADRSVIVDPTVLIRRPDGAGGVVEEYARGMCTNYQITAEVALRVQIRVERMPSGVGPNAWMNPVLPPRIVIENFKLLPAIEY